MTTKNDAPSTPSKDSTPAKADAAGSPSAPANARPVVPRARVTAQPPEDLLRSPMRTITAGDNWPTDGHLMIELGRRRVPSKP